MKKVFLFLSLSSALLFASDSAVIFGLKDGGSLSLRKAPIDGNKIGQLKNGDKLTILETKGKWHKVTVIASNKTGWAHGNWIKVSPTGKKDVNPIKPAQAKAISTKKAVHKPSVQKRDINHNLDIRP